MKSVLITGICGGIGIGIAEHLIHNGWSVFGTDISKCPHTLELAGFWLGDVADEWMSRQADS